MAEEQELFLAATWALELIGVQEIREKFQAINEKVQVHYDTVDHMLVLRGPHNDRFEAQYVSILESFIEEHKCEDLQEDLLQIPRRLRRLEHANLADNASARLTSGRGSTTGAAGEAQAQQHLLDVCEPFGPQSHSPIPSPPVSQIWIPSSETQAYYADDQFGIIPQLAAITGTTILREVLNHSVRFSIAGKNAEAVEVARMRLDMLEAPMALVTRPHRATVVFGSKNPSARYRIVKQGIGHRGQQPAAFSRMLTPQESKIDIAQTGLLVAEEYDKRTKQYELPRNIVSPPAIRRTQSETIEDWKGFKIPTLGSSGSLPRTPSLANPLSPIPLRSSVRSETGQIARPVTGADEAISRGQESTTPRLLHVPSAPAEVTSSLPPSSPAPVLPTSEASTPSTIPVSGRQLPGVKSRKVRGGGEVPAPKAVQTGPLSSLLSYLRLSSTEEPPRSAPSTTSPPPPSVSPPASSTEPAPPTCPPLSTSHPSVAALRSSAGPVPASSPTTSSPLLSPRQPSSSYPSSPRQPSSLPVPSARKRAASQPSSSPPSTPSAQPAPLARSASSARRWPGGFLFPKSDKKKEEAPAPRPSTTVSMSVRSFSSKQQAQRDDMESKPTGPRPSSMPPDKEEAGSKDKKKSFITRKQSLRTRRYKPTRRGKSQGTSATTAPNIEASSPTSNEASVIPGPTEEAQPMQESPKPCVEAQAGQLIDLQDCEEVPANPSTIAALEEARELNKLHNGDAAASTPASPMSQSSPAPLPRAEQDASREDEETRHDPGDSPEDWRALVNFDTPEPYQYERRCLDGHVSPDLPSSDSEPTTKAASQPASSGKKVTFEGTNRDSEQLPDRTEEIKEDFRELDPALAAAKNFPGSVTVDVQIGLVPITDCPSSMRDTSVTLQKLQHLFLNEPGLQRAAASTSFINKLTTSPADVDAIIGIESKGQKVFEPAAAEHHICYEFRCETPAGKSVIVKIDDEGEMTITCTPNLLGIVHLSFPAFVWDAAVFLHGHTSASHDLDTQTKTAARYLAGRVKIVSGQPVRLLGQTTDQLKVKQVIVTRTTLHHCRQDNPEPPALCLRITEIQDLLISSHPADENVFEARCGPLAEMVPANRQWWEVGLTSPAINKLLKTSEGLLPSGSAVAWSSADILGNDVALVACDDDDAASHSPGGSSSSSHPVAAAIGSSGLGGLLRLTEVVVQSIDGVGGANGAMGDGTAGESSPRPAVVSAPAGSLAPAARLQSDSAALAVIDEESGDGKARGYW